MGNCDGKKRPETEDGGDGATAADEVRITMRWLSCFLRFS